MLTEENVITAVCDYLKGQGYRIDQQLGPKQHGVDIIATHPTSEISIRVEPKGGTSSRPGTRRFGKGFSRAQSCVYVAAALYAAIATRDAHSRPNDRLGVAFPSTRYHREFIGRIQATLRTLGIAVFWAPLTFAQCTLKQKYRE